MDIRLFPPEELYEATVMLPLSKSISNRALVMNSLAGESELKFDVAGCDDTSVMVAALSAENGSTVNVGAAGSAMRFLTAYFASREGITVTLEGSERMHRRPIGVLVDALRRCGADIKYAGEDGFPPLVISGRRLKGGELSMPGDVSSQFVSALLMVAPLMDEGLRLTLEGDIVSTPYIKMTIGMMSDRGIVCEMERNVVTVSPGTYNVVDTPVERDWSSASYWYSIGALSSSVISMPGLERHSLQGDSVLTKYFEQLGVLTERDDSGALCTMPSPEMYSRIELDLIDQPDLAQTIAVTCCALNVPFTLTGLSTLRVKETDRLEAMCRELDRIGCIAEVRGGSALVWDGARHPVFEMPEIETYDDHRMAMAFAPLSLYIPGLVIKDAGVVSKSYPGFWDDLINVGFTIEEIVAE